jgi:hypothetical protein
MGPITVKLRASRLRRTLRNGLALRVTCADECAVTGRLVAPKTAARANGLGRRAVTVARGSVTAGRPGTMTLRLRFTRKAKRRLAHARRVTLSLRLTLRQGQERSHRTSRVRLTR